VITLPGIELSNSILVVLTEDRADADWRTADRSVGRLSDGLWWGDIAQSVADVKQLLLVGGSLGLSSSAKVW